MINDLNIINLTGVDTISNQIIKKPGWSIVQFSQDNRKGMF